MRSRFGCLRGRAVLGLRSGNGQIVSHAQRVKTRCGFASSRLRLSAGFALMLGLAVGALERGFACRVQLSRPKSLIRVLGEPLPDGRSRGCPRRNGGQYVRLGIRLAEKLRLGRMGSSVQHRCYNQQHRWKQNKTSDIVVSFEILPERGNNLITAMRTGQSLR
jgi:hypothetical protein